MDKAKVIYWLLMSLVLITALGMEFNTDFDGLVEEQTMPEIIAQYASILITLLLIYLALKLIRKNPIIRILMLFVPMMANVVMYHIFSLTPSFGYLSIMCLLASAFVYPSKAEEKNATEVSNDKTPEE